MDSQCWVMFWNNRISPIPLMMLPGMANAAVPFPPANMATKNNAPNPMMAKGQRKPQSTAAEKLACQGHETEDDQERTCDQSSSVGTICLHFILLSYFEVYIQATANGGDALRLTILYAKVALT